MIKIIIPALLIISLISFIIFRINNQTVEDIATSQTTTPKSSQTAIPEASPEASREGALTKPFEEPQVVDHEYISVKFKKGVDITEFAKRYNINEDKIEGPSLAEAYRIPVLEGENVVSTVELFEKDPDVVSAKFVLYAEPH